MRTIDADKLTPRCMFKGRCDSGGGLRCDRCTDYSVEYQDIKNAPTVSPERKTGRWIEHENADIVDGYYVPKYECSCCHTWKDDNSDYCPNCGADMRGEKE